VVSTKMTCTMQVYVEAEEHVHCNQGGQDQLKILKSMRKILVMKLKPKFIPIKSSMAFPPQDVDPSSHEE
jgi:hypothetical protein